MSDSSQEDARVFSVETRFHRMARRPGGMTRDEAITRAQTKLDEIKPSFDEWLDAALDELIAIIRKPGPDGPLDANWATTASLHSRRIRDVGTTMGCEIITFVANNLCGIFDDIASGAESHDGLIECHMEALALVRQPQYRRLRPDQLPELSNGLRRAIECVNTAHGTPK